MSTIYYSSRSARLSVHKLFTSCIRRGLVSRDSIVDGDLLPATVLSALSNMLSTQWSTSDVAENLGRFLVRGVQARGINELIPTVEMETIHAVEGYCFFGKNDPYGKIFKIIFWKYSSWQQSTCCVQILWNLADGKLAKSCVAYLTKKHFA